MLPNITRRVSYLKLAFPILLALLPILVASGGVATPAQAALPIDSPASSATNAQSTLVLKVYFRDAAERDRLATELGAEEVGTQGGYITVFGDQTTQSSLLSRGLRVEVDAEATTNANAYFARRDAPEPDPFYGGYRTVEEMQTFLDQKVAAYPTLAEKVDIGDSWCKTHPGVCTQPNAWNGFDLYVLHITNRNIAGPKPVFWYDAGIHSREIATPEVAMRFINYLLDNYDSNADAHWLVDYHDIWVMPMLNPDGHHMNESNGQGTPTLHRKNADRDDGCTTYDQFGTDINRNFPFQWGCCGGSSPNPCVDTYRGPAQNSEEETQAMLNKLVSLVPDQKGPNLTDPAPLNTTGTLINMHSNAEQNLYPWGFTGAYAPNRDDLRNIGRHMSSPNVEPVGNGYEYCQNTECLYIVDGDEKNWSYGELGIPSYSLELSGSGFFPPYNCLDSGSGCGTPTGLGIWPENRGALLHHAKIARTPYLLTRGPDANVVATNPMTVTQGTISQLSATLNYNWVGSDGQPNIYLQNMMEGEYYIDTPPWAGGTAIPMTATDGAYDEPTEAAGATIDTSSIPVGRHIIFVRGRGVNDYGGFGSWGPITAAWLTVTSTGGTPTVTPAITVTPISTPTLPATSIPTLTSTRTATLPATSTSIPTTANTSTAIATPSRTSTSVAQTATPIGSITPSSCCGSMTGGVLASCQVDPTPSTSSYQGLVELNNPCPYPVPVTVTSQLHVSIDGTTWQVWAQTPARQFSVPPGPLPFGINEYFYNQSIDAQYVYYRVFSIVNETNFCREYFLASTTQAICRSGMTPTAVPTSTPCAITFTDVDTENPFYTWIRCLACRGIISGYSDGTFRPNAEISRGQIAKMVSNSAGFGEDPGAQIYEDVPSSSPFYSWINRLSMRGHMGGYNCGIIPEEPCGLENRPYFRPSASATRGQLAKIVANAAGLTGTSTELFYTDVQLDNPFYVWIMRLTNLNVMSGYQCGGPGEPCDESNRPYFRPYATVTRGQASKIVANTFYPGCQTP